MGENAVRPKRIFASLPRTERGRSIVISGDPKGKNFLYSNGNSVYIRDIEDPSVCDIYTQHSSAVAVAKYAPSGFYIASGDSRGKIRIWDTTQLTHILKYEYQPLSGAIRDIAWSPDNKRIIVCGEGREKFAAAFLWDTGSSVGTLDGHSKSVNALDFRQTRPYRAVTASEDQNLCFFEGPPFKHTLTITDHKNFVNCVRFTPNGEKFISCSSDGRAMIFDGKTGERTGELGSPAHKGGVYAISFNKEGDQALTVSGDKTAKIFDVASGDCLVEFVMGSEIPNQQLGCLWQGDHLLTVSLSGHITYLDRDNPSQPLRVIKGHAKPITAMCINEDKSLIMTGSTDALINLWNPATGECEEIKGNGHKNQVQDMVAVDDTLVSVSMDDTIRFTSISSGQYSTSSLPVDSQPKAVSAAPGGTAVVACAGHVCLFQNEMKVFTQKVSFDPSSVAINPNLTEVAVGGGLQDMSIHLFTLENGILTERTGIELKHSGQITDLKYSPDGAFLAATDTNRRMSVYELPAYTQKLDGSRHTARINCVAWSPDSNRFATASLDTNITVWTLTNPSNPYTIKGAHLQSNVTRLGWLGPNTLVSVAFDSTVKQWDIPE